MTKRALDIVIALPLAVLTAPAVALLALAIRLESPGGAIYRQVRVGKDGRTFEIFKLRTMVSGAEFTGAGLAIAEGDSRITPLGRLMRRYSLDELPNLWNVLRGEMSIVGRVLRSSIRSTTTRRVSAAAWKSSRGSPGGPRSMGGPRCRGLSGSSLICGTSSINPSPWI